MIEALLSGLTGALLGAFIGPYFQEGLQRKRILKEQKAQILRDLMATKFTGACDQKGAEAINYIPVLFAKNEKVLVAYRDYHSALINGHADLSKRFTALIVAIANSIGIELDSVDLMRDPIISHQRRADDMRTLQYLAGAHNDNA